jgi:hypothetical protein
MAIQTITDQSPLRDWTVEDLLSEIKQRGAPLRIDTDIDTDTDTYYVLRMDQLLALLEDSLQDAQPTDEFVPEDFGLTGADLAAYQARRAARRNAAPANQQVRLDASLVQRLAKLKGKPTSYSTAERESLLQALESAMLRNLQATLSATQGQ